MCTPFTYVQKILFFGWFRYQNGSGLVKPIFAIFLIRSICDSVKDSAKSGNITRIGIPYSKKVDQLSHVIMRFNTQVLHLLNLCWVHG